MFLFGQSPYSAKYGCHIFMPDQFSESDDFDWSKTKTELIRDLLKISTENAEEKMMKIFILKKFKESIPSNYVAMQSYKQSKKTEMYGIFIGHRMPIHESYWYQSSIILHGYQ